MNHISVMQGSDSFNSGLEDSPTILQRQPLPDKLKEAIVHVIVDECAPIGNPVNRQMEKRACVFLESRMYSLIKIGENVPWDVFQHECIILAPASLLDEGRYQNI